MRRRQRNAGARDGRARSLRAGGKAGGQWRGRRMRCADMGTPPLDLDSKPLDVHGLNGPSVGGPLHLTLQGVQSQS
eukprot:CAMPEP_0183454978 /NCGR_PEP_ID=MMETSP0370-20130417/125477_1 /TAXON_ID=268820 /ORGANISM="Peridinium aciculiferum, Strain PAER-2" /LENGTH=75 /DNA_ID=CAMNT_0025646533 /DNA_START=19 /DNA_END=246 /DNA_ORIENTATION=-